MEKELAFAIAIFLDLVLAAAILAKHWKSNHFAENCFLRQQRDRGKLNSCFDLELKKQWHFKGFRQLIMQIERACPFQ